MKKIKLLSYLLIILLLSVTVVNYFSKSEDDQKQAKKESSQFKKEKKRKKTLEERRRSVEQRNEFERTFQVNPNTGEIPELDKKKEIEMSHKFKLEASQKNSRANSATFASRGPSNLGGRTRSLVIDRTDATSNTIIAGGVSGGVFRTTDGGASWKKVSSNGEIHNVTTIAQDPRSGSENIWYYGTGEFAGNSASGGGATFLGQGIWQSTDNGVTWTQIPSTASTQESDDSEFDIIYKIAVHPVTGDLYAATRSAIRRFDGTAWTTELETALPNKATDLVITSTGIVYASFAGNGNFQFNGVWQSPTGVGSWTRVGSNQDDGLTSAGRMVIAVAPSNENIVYAFYLTSNADQAIQAGLAQWDASTDTWTDYSFKMPDEPGDDSSGNDPIAVLGGYDLIVNVKPNDENFVVIGGTNAYKIEDIVNDATFVRIGGYRDNGGYALYSFNGDDHHPDIHALDFDPNNPDVLFSGTDGGVHKTTDVTATTVGWTNLNNNYQTYQFFHVAIDPESGSDFVIGGAQDNGTVAGGLDTSPDLTTMTEQLGGDGVSVGVSRDDACRPFFAGFQRGPIFRSCPSFVQITPDIVNADPNDPKSIFVTYFYLDPSNNNALYYAAENTFLRTTNSTAVTSSTWDGLGDLSLGTSSAGDSNEFIRQFSASWGAYDASSSYLMIGGDAGSLVRLDDPQNASFITSAVDITPPGVARTKFTVVSGIAIHPTNPDIVMVTYSNYGIENIFVTTNATSATPTWTLAERNLDLFSIRSAAITEVGGETFYFVGTARGLYASTDPVNEDWVLLSPDQIGFAVVSSLAYRPADNKLLVGTHGNGMYEGTVSTLSVDEFNRSSASIITYPNPTTDLLNVVVENTFVPGDLTYSVVDLTGKVVKTGELNAEKQINVQELTNGLYVLQLASKSKSKSITFVKK